MRENHDDFKISEAGLHVSKERIHVAASPDGLVSFSCCGPGVLDIKCSLPIPGAPAGLEKLSYLNSTNGELKLRTSHQHFSQTQLLMYCLGCTYCDFFCLS